jgi:Na+/proline symporter
MHLLDIIIVAAYLVVVIYIGKRASASSKNEEGFFLAGRKLGKFYQFFLNFGNATEPQGAVSTASLVYNKGVSGTWTNFQTIFLNPFYWFVYVWFRRVRVTTVADLFVERFNSRKLAVYYSVFQMGVAVILLGVANVTAYKITSSMLLKPEAQWSAADQQGIAAFNHWQQLEVAAKAGPLSDTDKIELADLRDLKAKNKLHSYVSWIGSESATWAFYIIFTAVVGAYMIMGGMKAAAFNDALQGFLIVIFSVMLIPVGLHAIGGWHALTDFAQQSKTNYNKYVLVGAAGSNQYGFWYILFYTWASLVQILGLSANMGILGSATNEYAARFGGVSGTYAKRLLIIVWAFVGLIACSLFLGPNSLVDPDGAWGKMSSQLLAPGFIGLMLAGVLAGTMSIMAAKAVAISSLFVCNIYRPLRPTATDAQGVLAARWAIFAVLIVGVFAPMLISGLEDGVKFIIEVNVPFGAAIMLLYTWRRLTPAAVWLGVTVAILANLVIPRAAQHIDFFALRPSLTMVDAQNKSVYFESVVHSVAENPQSALQGNGRFNFEVWMLSRVGLRPAEMTAVQRETAKFAVDGLLPFALLIAFSFVTKKSDKNLVDQYYGKMKTPVLPTPELEAAALAETRRNPGRFDHLKLLPGTQWEFLKWDRTDTVGFLTCCTISFSVVLLFIFLLKLASGALPPMN